MKQFLVLLSVLAPAFGLSLFGKLDPGLRIRFPSYYEISRTEEGAINDGWTEVDRGDSEYLPSLKLYCPVNDYTFCTLFDDLGYVSGVRVAVPVANFTEIPVDPYTLGMRTWTSPESNNYYTTHQFFISEETLQADASVRNALRANEDTLYEGALWVPSFDGSLTRIDALLPNNSDIWNRQACTPGMGRHYMYNMTSDGNCDRMLPWFLLYQDDQLVGTGFNSVGKLPEEERGQQAWFERINRLKIKLTMPNAAECLYDYGSENRIITMHIYYVASPLKITCLFN